MHTARSLPLALALGVLTSCSGTPTHPTPTPDAPPISTRWSAAGQIVETLTGTPIANPLLDFGSLGSITGDGEGRFLLERDGLPGVTAYPVTISAPGHVTRRVYFTWQRAARTGISVDLIRDAVPFSGDFYRKLVRNAWESPGQLRPLARWTTPPRFYIRTVDDLDGAPVPPEVIASVRHWIGQGVQWWSGMAPGTIETGTESRSPARGVIRVLFLPRSTEFCGRANVAADPGFIELALEGCGCGREQIAPDLILHEVGHSMGFWHVDDRRSIMFGTFDCQGPALSPADSHHAAIAYRRPVGSLDVDNDPDGPPNQQPLSITIAD